MSRRYGDREACTRCGLDIEWHGREYGWLDRGGNQFCSRSNASYASDGSRIPMRRGKHTVR